MCHENHCHLLVKHEKNRWASACVKESRTVRNLNRNRSRLLLVAVILYKVQFSSAVRKKGPTSHQTSKRWENKKRKCHASPDGLFCKWNVCSKGYCDIFVTHTVFSVTCIQSNVPFFCFQMAAKMGDQMPNMNSSSPVLDPSLYGYGGQKRSLDNGGKISTSTNHTKGSFLLVFQIIIWRLHPTHFLYNLDTYKMIVCDLG